MKTTDNVSCELQKIEKEVDNYYKSNPLPKLPFATAAWSLLAYAEDYMLNEQSGGISKIRRFLATPFETQGSFFMNLIDVFERFPDQESCIEHLERIRWRLGVQCPVCECKT